MRKTRIKRSFGLLLVLAMIGSWWTASTVSASTNPWYDQYVAYESVHGGDYYNSPESGTLAWGESYWLNSYMNMYGLTKNTTWLDKIVTHTDAMIANANDVDGDGYLGWSAFRYSPVEIDNTTFATAASGDATLPANWIRFQSTSTTGYRSNASGAYHDYGGAPPDTWGLVLKTNGTSWQSMYQPLNSFVPNRSYVLNFYAKTNGSAAKGRAYILDTNLSTGVKTIIASQVIDSTSWDFYSVEFVSPPAGHSVQVWLGHNTYTVTGGIAYFDRVQVNRRVPYIVHDGMIGTPIAEFVRLIKSTPSLQAAYLTKANSYLDFLEDHLVKRWDGSSAKLGQTYVAVNSSSGYYIDSPNLDSVKHYAAGENRILPHNMYLAFGNLLSVLHDITGTASYWDRAQAINTYFKSTLTYNTPTGSYNWKYKETAAKIEDISHGNIDVEAAITLFNKASTVYNGNDVVRFANTLKNKVWNQSTTAPKLHNFVDGSASGGGGTLTDYTYTKYMTGWTQLAQFDPKAWELAADQYSGYTLDNSAYALTATEIMRWDPERVVNGGFEYRSYGDTTLPARWARISGTTSAYAYLDSVNRTEGEYGVAVKANLSTWTGLYQDWTEWKPNTTYTLTFDGKTDGGLAGGRIFVYNATNSAAISPVYDFDNTTWQTNSFTFTTPSNTSLQLRVYLENHSTTVNGTAYFDNVKIRLGSDPF
ncbi:carbohydrate binding domain-containing protein [Paenibacillus koleovorans]|uniref:carbohydrate binding domain-containing protein n=1 Tax=Paenibacillus koleovorans TaxID=121608 RepID=UPI0013E3FF47|nr:carbohydrate binding domain-containing protein [Paenibacillus koleovorans]